MFIRRVFVTLAAFVAVTAIGSNNTYAQGLGFAQSLGGLTISEAIQGWDGSLAAGLNSRSGNTETFDGSGILNATKETDRALTTLQASYFYSANNNVAINDRFYALGRRDIKLTSPSWMSLFYQGWYERDRFRNFDYRLAFHGGIGILLLEDDIQYHKLRIGAGASKEFGGPNDEWIPELLFGYDCRRQLTERTAIFLNADYFPNLEDFSDYRFNTLAGAEILLDPDMDLSLRFSVYNRYDSTPVAGNVASDTDYIMSLVFGF